MADLLRYTGNAGLGLGSSPGIPAMSGNENLTQINNTARDLMLLDNQRNIMLYQQKIKDRDTLTAMIMEDQVSTGDILPEYQPFFDTAQKEVERAFKSWKGNFNDTKGYNDYKQAVTRLKDVATHAQVNSKMVQQLRQEQAQATLPRKKEDIGKWLDGQMKQPFWNAVTPYQQLHDFNMDDILSGVNPIKTVVTDPQNPIYKYDVSYIDYNDILRNKRNQYIHDMDAANSIDQFVDKFQRYGNDDQIKTISAIDAQISKYNQDRGFKEGDEGFVKPVQKELIEGKLLIREPKTEFAAKYALANQQQFMTRTPMFQKDYGTYEVQKERNLIDAMKLGLDRTAKLAYARHMDAMTATINRALKAEKTNILQQYMTYVNSIKPSSLMGGPGRAKGEHFDAVFLDDLPSSWTFINGPVVDSKGKVKVDKLEPFVDTTGRKYYETKYVDPATGQQVDLKSNDMQEAYKASKKAGIVNNYDDFIKVQLRKGSIQIMLKGKNGTSNYTSMYQSAKALNAVGTTKGEENIVNPPGDVQDQIESQNDQQNK